MRFQSRTPARGMCWSLVRPLPLTLGHEVAGIIEKVGGSVSQFRRGDRVCLHYLASCGMCQWCQRGNEQFCVSGAMMGKFRDGGFAEFVVMPARSVIRLPDEIPFEQGAILMCSSATSLHALNKGRLRPGESLAVSLRSILRLGSDRGLRSLAQFRSMPRRANRSRS